MAEAQFTCNECEGHFKLENPIVGEKFGCPECGISLKVTSVGSGKVQTEMIEEEIEDWGE